MPPGPFRELCGEVGAEIGASTCQGTYCYRKFPNKTTAFDFLHVPSMEPNNQSPKIEQREREEKRGDLTCESGNAYLHANYVTRRGGNEGKAPPMRQTEPGRRRKDIADTREKRRGTSDCANGQTNEGIKDHTCNPTYRQISGIGTNCSVAAAELKGSGPAAGQRQAEEPRAG
ncbi:hypothetical protein JOQ06_018436, partial [Pogonophryne albipinna]